VDGIVGVANSDGGKRPGGLGSSSLDCRRTFVHPSRHRGGELLKKHSVSGRNYCSAGLEGGGMKRRLVLQPKLRELIAGLSQHRSAAERLGQRLREAEYAELKAGLGREDVRVVRRFLPGEGEQQPVAEETRRRLLVQQRAMVREKNRAMLRLLEGIEADLQAHGMSPRLWSGASSCTIWGPTTPTVASSDTRAASRSSVGCCLATRPRWRTADCSGRTAQS
jgi:hypothetical protein